MRDWAVCMRDDLAGAHAKYLPRLERALLSSPGEYFAGAALSFVDVQWFRHACDALRLDAAAFASHVELERHHQRIAALPRIAAYMDSPRRYPWPGLDGYFDRVRAVIPWRYGDAMAPAMAHPRWRFD